MTAMANCLKYQTRPVISDSCRRLSCLTALKMTFVMGRPRFIIQQRVWVPRGLAVQMPVRIRNRQTRLLAQRQPGTSINTLGSYAPR